ncbi:glycoside hydrolase family 31 protein [Lophiostoma macrostomum CBS 122681]|uniref:Glycoside hydrolase family 31 protein n=1 Tax=Lophiostoma macrostomum CBS 122681 TaxID=1314788 RepID=A0A6A6TW20_9PLEO|nr:glycoside hydrolase family 31 protein [Lophiostoma macrostomum CBS 122681]
MVGVSVLASLAALVPGVLSQYTVSWTKDGGLLVADGNRTVVNNSAILAGGLNTTVTPLGNGTEGVSYELVTPTVARVQLNTSGAFHGARFSDDASTRFFGVWEYPFNYQIDNKNISFDLKGVGNSVGINWSNARAPFFLTSTGYGVYTDTLTMGSYDFTTAGSAQFIFNSSSLVYYIILPSESSSNPFKSIITQYTALSARSEMPPTSGLGPTFWSDDFTLDFHGNVSNAQENIKDVFNQLRDNKIRATSTFADRPYGTGNRSWGNFDFDPTFYPDPAAFIANLKDSYGIDFAVWIANRGQLGTELYNASLANGWQIPPTPSITGGLGPALNLSLPAAYSYFTSKLEYFPATGVRGYKIDRGEEGEMPDWAQNIQMDLFLRLAYDTMASRWGASGFYNFARSAVDRSRAVTHIWNGDSHANFSGLAYSVASGIRAGLVAFPVWGSDTGGYIREGDDPFTPSVEVWGRWMWFSAFSPVYELMLGTNHTPWYAPYADAQGGNSVTVDVLKQTANLHAELTPYIKSYAYEATKTGVPIIRALFLETGGVEEESESLWEVSDQYFFGGEFLVAPVVAAGGKRSVYFPKGASRKYLEYFGKKQVFVAGSSANVSVGLDAMPVYVKQGAIVPRGDVYQGNAKWIENWQPFLSIEVFPSLDVRESGFTYYDGEGAEGRAVEISLKVEKTDGGNADVRVDYEDLGVEAEVVWYLKSGEKRVNLSRGGGSTSLEDVELLF